MNKTREDEDDEHHHDDDDDSDKGRYLFAVNSSRTVFEILGAPAFRNFTSIVYIVTKANDIFKSQEFLVQTGEGGRWYLLLKGAHCVTVRIAARLPVLVVTHGNCNSSFASTVRTRQYIFHFKLSFSFIIVLKYTFCV